MENKWQKKLISKHEITMLPYLITRINKPSYTKLQLIQTIKAHEKKATYFNYQR